MNPLSIPNTLTTTIPSPTLSLNFTEKRPAPVPHPPSPTRTLRHVSLEMRERVLSFLACEGDDEVLERVKAQTRVSMGVIEQALARYGPDQLALSYNGGKDCLVLLVLLLACLPAWESSTTAESRTIPTTLQALYVISTNPFPEVQSFVATTAHEYRLDLASFSDGMRAALADYLVERPGLRAVFVGTRRTDPHGASLAHFDPTDESWPACMRVHPVLDWHYVEIWAFIRALDTPYCKLYDMGYTSLGGMGDTKPNPALAITDSDAFKPAYELVEDSKERLGRFTPPPAERRASRASRTTPSLPGTSHQAA